MDKVMVALRAMKKNGETIDHMAHAMGFTLDRYDHDTLVGRTWWVADDYDRGEVEAVSGREAAQNWVDDGDWGKLGESIAIRLSVWRDGYTVDEDGVSPVRCDEDTHLFIVHPDEPRCGAACDGKHRWVDGDDDDGLAPGLRGGTGCSITTVEVCTLCGMSQVEQSASQGHEQEHDHTTRWYGDEDYDVDIDELAAWHGHEAPEGLAPGSPLAEACEAGPQKDDSDEEAA